MRRVGEELKRFAPAILGTHVHVEAAVAGADLTNIDAHNTLPFGLNGPVDIGCVVHKALYRRGYATGVIHPDDDLTGVKLFIIPHWVVFDPAWVPSLERFVRAGGTLVIGARTATRDLDNNVVAETIPGCLRKLAGVTVEEYSRINAPELQPHHVVINGKKALAEQWREILVPDKGTKTMAKWRGGHFKGRCAVSLRTVGKGAVVYAGVYLTGPMIRLLLPALAGIAGLEPLWPAAPKGVEVVRRQDDKKQVWFFINHNEKPCRFRMPDGKIATLKAGDVRIVGA